MDREDHGGVGQLWLPAWPARQPFATRPSLGARGQITANLPRGGRCPVSYLACTDLDPDVCCPDATICSLNFNNEVACCLEGAVCTGIANHIGPATTAASGASSISSSTASSTAVPFTSNDVNPSVTSPAATNSTSVVSNGAATGGGSLSLSTGAQIGSIIGGIAGLGALVATIYYGRKQAQRRRERRRDMR